MHWCLVERSNVCRRQMKRRVLNKRGLLLSMVGTYSIIKYTIKDWLIRQDWPRHLALEEVYGTETVSCIHRGFVSCQYREIFENEHKASKNGSGNTCEPIVFGIWNSEKIPLQQFFEVYRWQKTDCVNEPEGQWG